MRRRPIHSPLLPAYYACLTYPVFVTTPDFLSEQITRLRSAKQTPPEEIP